MCGGPRRICAARYELWITSQPPCSHPKPPCGDPQSWDPVMSSGASLMLCPAEAGAGATIAGVFHIIFRALEQRADPSNQFKYFNLFLLREEGNLPLLLRAAIEYLTFPSSPSAHHALCHPEKHTRLDCTNRRNTRRLHARLAASAHARAPPPSICRRFDYRAPWR